MKFNLRILLTSLLSMGIMLTGCGGEKKEAAKTAVPVELHISAAASMTDAMKEIAGDYQKKNPDVKLVFNFAASGELQQAIEQGAPVDIFISAAKKQMDALDKGGFLAEGTRKDLLENKVVLIVPKDSKIALTKFEDVLDNGIYL